MGLFDPFLVQKYQKENGFDLGTHIQWTNEMSWVEKYWSHPLSNSKNIILVQRTCGKSSFSTHIFGSDRSPRSHYLCLSVCPWQVWNSSSFKHKSSSNQPAISQQSVSSQSAVIYQSVRSVQVCLEQSIFIFPAQIFKQSVRNQSAPRKHL